MANLDIIFNPRTIALIGASRDVGSVGHGILKNLISGCVFPSEYCRPFKGKVYPVNPNAEEILGIRCYADIKDIDMGAKVGLRWGRGPFEIMNDLGIEKSHALVENVLKPFPGLEVPKALKAQMEKEDSWNIG